MMLSPNEVQAMAQNSGNGKTCESGWGGEPRHDGGGCEVDSKQHDSKMILSEKH